MKLKDCYIGKIVKRSNGKETYHIVGIFYSRQLETTLIIVKSSVDDVLYTWHPSEVVELTDED